MLGSLNSAPVSCCCSYEPKLYHIISLSGHAQDFLVQCVLPGRKLLAALCFIQYKTDKSHCNELSNTTSYLSATKCFQMPCTARAPQACVPGVRHYHGHSVQVTKAVLQGFQLLFSLPLLAVIAPRPVAAAWLDMPSPGQGGHRLLSGAPPESCTLPDEQRKWQMLVLHTAISQLPAQLAARSMSSRPGSPCSPTALSSQYFLCSFSSSSQTPQPHLFP